MKPVAAPVTPAAAVGALLVAAIAFAMHLRYLDVPLVSDEGAYAYAAYFWAQGDRLYEDVVLYRPQAMIVLYRFILGAFGPDVQDIRLALAVSNTLTTAAVFLTARYLMPAGPALLAALFFALFATSSNLEGFIANAEPFVNLAATVSAFFLLRAHATRSLFANMVLSGMCAGLAAQLKPSGLAALVLGVAALVLLNGAGDFLRKPRGWHGLAGLLSGFVLSLVPALLHGYSIGWDTFLHAALGFSLGTASPFSQSFDTQLLKLLQSLAIFVGATAGLLAILIARRAVPRPRTPVWPDVFMFLWLGSASLGIAAGGSWWMHYYLLALPPLCIFAALTFQTFIAPLLRSDAAARKPSAPTVAIVLTIVPAALWSSFLLAHPAPPVWLSEAAAIGAFVADRTAPGDRILVTDAAPHVYYLARRRAATPYLFLGEPEGHRLPGIAAELTGLVTDPARRPPIVVIPNHAVGLSLGMQTFYDAVQMQYSEAARFGPAVVYQRPVPMQNP